MTLAQPIAGVPANRETEIEVVYPSIASGALGRFIGMFMGMASHVPTLPLRLLAYVALGLPMAGLAVLAYALNKISGTCYVLTTQSITPRPIVGGRPGKAVPLSEIAEIEITSSGSGYEYHRVGDLVLQNAQGATLLTIPAIAFPQRLKQIILDTQNARLLSDESLAVIRGRA